MTATARTRERVEREYGEQKWPAVQRLVEREIEAEGTAAGLARIHARVVRAYAHPGDGLEPHDAILEGAPLTLPRSLAFGALQAMAVEAVLDACTPQTDLVVELGSGWGWHILGTWLAGGPRDALYVGAELTEAGRQTAARLAGLDPELRFRSLEFDYEAPSLAALGRAREAVVFTGHSIEQLPELSPAVIDAIADLAETVTCLHFEPVGWQVGGHARQGSSREYAEQHGYNRNLVALVRDAERAGRLRIDAVRPELMGVNPRNATTLVAWHSPADGG
ncbi:MAG: hypothetical protein Q8O56_05405 [Solirubrobacteraceae bacterium]|nr:hypothetical protein [Solirubrobacteraceae bacterium]